MTIYDVTFTIQVPDNISDNDLLAWLRYNLHDVCELSLKNPLADTELEGRSITVRKFRC
jgi:hypothetical protein